MSQTNAQGERVRVQRPVRDQITMRFAALDQLLPLDHRVRALWQYVEALDLAPLYQSIRAVSGAAGRDAVDPRILLALWLQATLEGVSSARQLDRLCQRDIVFQWICGDVGVNYDLLSQFRTRHGAFLEQLLIDTIATLLHQDLVTLDVVAQDGMRVRASAGSSSFRREKTLKECHEAARRHLESLPASHDQDPSRDDQADEELTLRRTAARTRVALDREQRVARALEELAVLQQQKEGRKKGTGSQARCSTTRCSTTDPEARIMKMSDGGFRPAYNVQFATEGGSRLIVGVDVTNAGSDRCQLVPMHQRLEQQYGRVPGDYLVDGGFVTHEAVTQVEQARSRVVGPIFAEEQLKKKGIDPAARQRRDTDQTFAFRQRMSTEAGKQLLKRRPSIAEYPNATSRNRGLSQFRVRGLSQVRVVALWQAVAHNFERMRTLNWLPRLLKTA